MNFHDCRCQTCYRMWKCLLKKKKIQVTCINARRCCIHLSICIKCAASLTSAFLFSSCNNHAWATNKRGQLVFSLKGDSPQGGPAHSAPPSVFLGNGGRVCGAASVLPLMWGYHEKTPAAQITCAFHKYTVFYSYKYQFIIITQRMLRSL